jgi:hypothetical protein
MDDILLRIASFAGNQEPQAKTAATEKDLDIKKESYGHLKTCCNVTSSNETLGILCFSKDRPFQLEQFLISTEKFVQSTANTVKIIVLFSPG